MQGKSWGCLVAGIVLGFQMCIFTGKLPSSIRSPGASGSCAERDSIAQVADTTAQHARHPGGSAVQAAGIAVHPQPAETQAAPSLREDYLKVVREAITGYSLRVPGFKAKHHRSMSELETVPFDPDMREKGKDWPQFGYSMAGNMRLQNVQQLLETALSEGIPGGFVECGVWRGGSSIYAAAVLHAHGVTDRDVHLVDSFKGLPPNTTAKDHDKWYGMEYLIVSLEQVQEAFRSFGLLGLRVHFHQGYFRYVLPQWRGGDRSPIAVLRMDGDMWESTMDQFYNLWDDISPGGFIIVDDYGAVPAAQRAVNEFLDKHGVQAELHDIDGSAAWFRKPFNAAPAALAWGSGASIVASTGQAAPSLREDYLKVVREAITGYSLRVPGFKPKIHKRLSELETVPFDPDMREKGKDWPQFGYSMAGNMRLQNVQQLLETALSEGIPGGFVECGVWRGGSSIYAAAVLHAHGVTDRDVHLVDSFKGLPPNTTGMDHDQWYGIEYLQVSLEQVQEAFRSFGLLGPRVHFHQGYFRYSLPQWRGGDRSPIAVLRMDGDMWESTMDQFYNLWDDISPGGFIIVDDYHSVPPAQRAVNEFLDKHGVQAELHDIDGSAAWFRKPFNAAPAAHAWYAEWNASRSLDDRLQ